MELENLIKNVRDFFLNEFGKKRDNTKSFLAFEPLGQPISLDDFKIDGVFNPTIAAEELSIICDKVPKIDSVFQADGLRSFGETYEALITSIEFTDVNLKQETGNGQSVDIGRYMALFNDVKSKAQLAAKKQASVLTQNGSFYLTRATPSTWYDANSPIWTQKTISHSTTQSNSSTVGISVKDSKIFWKTAPTRANLVKNAQFSNILKNGSLVEKINISATQLNTKVLVNRNIEVLKDRGGIGDVLSTGPILSKASTIPSSGGVITKTDTIPPVLTTQFKTKPSPILKAGVKPVFDRLLYNSINVAVPFKQKIYLYRDINMETEQVTSSNFQLDFAYCVVMLNRPWLTATVFDYSKLWYSAAQNAGYYSTGTKDDTNTGVLRAIPTAMIVIKDLKITANWSEKDRKLVTTSLGFGSFNIASSSFNSANNNQLIAPGIQILGWVCEVLPKLPINDDINIL